MMHTLARRERSGFSRAVWLLGLAALLLALWAGRAAAVTMKGAHAARLAALSSAVVHGVPGASSLDYAVPLPDDDEARAVAEAHSPTPEWAKVDLSASAVMQVATAGVASRLTIHMVKVENRHDLASEFERSYKRTAKAKEKAKPALEPRDPLSQSLDENQVVVVRRPEEPKPVSMVASIGRWGLGPSWWVALLGAPGLVAMAVAFGGIVFNMPARDDD